MTSINGKPPSENAEKVLRQLAQLDEIKGLITDGDVSGTDALRIANPDGDPTSGKSDYEHWKAKLEATQLEYPTEAEFRDLIFEFKAKGVLSDGKQSLAISQLWQTEVQPDYDTSLQQVGMPPLAEISPAPGRRYSTLYFPIVQNSATGEVDVVVDPDFFTWEGIHHVADGYEMLEGQTAPDVKSFGRWTHRIDGMSLAIPELQGRPPNLSILVSQDTLGYTYASDGRIMPVVVYSTENQPITGLPKKEGNWVDIPGWWTADEANIIAREMNVAALEHGWEKSTCRRNDEGWRTEEVDGKTVTKAQYTTRVSSKDFVRKFAAELKRYAAMSELQDNTKIWESFSFPDGAILTPERALEMAAAIEEMVG